MEEIGSGTVDSPVEDTLVHNLEENSLAKVEVVAGVGHRGLGKLLPYQEVVMDICKRKHNFTETKNGLFPYLLELLDEGT